jgi:hypothetical protein
MEFSLFFKFEEVAFFFFFLAAPTSALQQERASVDNLREAQRTLNRTLDTGTDIIDDLHRQREVMKQTKGNAREINDVNRKNEKIIWHMENPIKSTVMGWFGRKGI